MKNYFKYKRAVVLLLAFLFLLNVVFAGGTEGLTEKGQDMGPGTYYKNTQLITADGRFIINTVEAALGTNFLKIEAGDSGQKIHALSVSKQIESKPAENGNVIAAINGDFFDMNLIKGLPIGTSIIDSEIRTAASSNVIFGVTDKDECFIGDLTMKGMIYLGDNSYPLDKVNRLRWNDKAIIYTPAFGATTGTNANGVELVVKGISLPLKGNKYYAGKVEAIYSNKGNTPIPADGIVISGEGAAAQFLAAAAIGQEINFIVDFSRPNLKYAVSGFPRLINNGMRADAEIAQREDAGQRHPRTAIGIKNGKVIMITVDGRQPNVSDGMTLYELADYLLLMGVENAVNLDGGGSTTMVVRKQGDVQAELVNVPSDGSERSVGNSIQFISEAPLSPPAYVAFKQENVQIYKGSELTPSFFVMDQYYNLLTLDDKAPVKYAADGKTGTVSKTGIYKAGTKPGMSYMDVSVGAAKGRLPITIVDTVGSLKIDNEFLHLNPGEKVQLNLKAYDASGNEIIISPAAVVWTVSGNVGKVDSKGVFTAGKANGDGKITVKIKDAAAELSVKIGKSPIVVNNFDKLDNIEIQTIRAKATIALSGKEEPIKNSKSALKLNYDFATGEVGTAVAYANFVQPIAVIGKPIKLGLWVYGDGGNHWLRGVYTNAKGVKKVFDFTGEGKLNWKGWQFVYTDIPAGEAYPIQIDKVYLAETKEDSKNKGEIFLDELTSVYNQENSTKLK